MHACVRDGIGQDPFCGGRTGRRAGENSASCGSPIMRMERMLTGDVAVASGEVAANLVNAQYEGITNFPIVAAFLSFFVAQSLKVLTTWYFRLRNFFAPPPDLSSLSRVACSTSEPPATLQLYKENRWDVKRLYGSGGMPSSHSATVTGLACAIGLREGLGGPLFAIAFVLACIVMYDASGVRLQAGRQAEVLNQIVFELPPEHPLSDSRPLKEFLGHTPPQVAAGAMLGCLIAYTLHLLSLILAGGGK